GNYLKIVRNLDTAYFFVIVKILLTRHLTLAGFLIGVLTHEQTGGDVEVQLLRAALVRSGDDDVGLGFSDRLLAFHLKLWEILLEVQRPMEIRHAFHHRQFFSRQFAYSGHRVRIPALGAIVDLCAVAYPGDRKKTGVFVRRFLIVFNIARDIRRFDLEFALGRARS